MGVNEYIKVGKRIKQARVAKGIKQKEMAKKLGLKVSTYANYENGYREPDLDVIQKASDILNVPMSILLNGNWYEYNNDISMVSDTNVNKYYSLELMKELFNKSGRYENEILDYLEQLNLDGKVEAVKRVEELTYIDKYKIDNEK